MPKKTDIATGALVVVLKSPSGGKTTAEIIEIAGLSVRTINSIYTRAIECSFNPNHYLLILHDEFLCNSDRPGRPKKQTDKAQIEIIAEVRRNRFGREKPTHSLRTLKVAETKELLDLATTSPIYSGVEVFCT